jgi:hypothetical protein
VSGVPRRLLALVVRPRAGIPGEISRDGTAGLTPPGPAVQAGAAFPPGGARHPSSLPPPFPRGAAAGPAATAPGQAPDGQSGGVAGGDPGPGHVSARVTGAGQLPAGAAHASQQADSAAPAGSTPLSRRGSPP